MNYREYINKVLPDEMGDYGEDFVMDYDLLNNDSSYLDDLFFEFADSRVDTSPSDILDYLVVNYSDVNDIIDELGWDGVGRDIIKAAQMAQIENIRGNLQEHKEGILLSMAMEFLYVNKLNEPVDDSQVDKIVSLIQGRDYDSLSDFLSDLEDLEESFDEDDEEEEEELEEKKQRRKRF